jgi:hypothetical protein
LLICRISPAIFLYFSYEMYPKRISHSYAVAGHITLFDWQETIMAAITFRAARQREWIQEPLHTVLTRLRKTLDAFFSHRTTTPPSADVAQSTKLR